MADQNTARHRAWADPQCATYSIERVENHGERGYRFALAGGLGYSMPQTNLVTPKIGDTLTVWGEGFCSEARGQAVNDIVVWYRDLTAD